MKRLVLQLGSALMLLGLAACAGAGSLFTTQPPQGAAGLGLPSPAELARAGSFTEPGLMREGSDFDAALPNNRALAAGSDASLTPLENGRDSASLAYCVYSFDVSGYDRDLSLRFTWVTPPFTNTGWVGLANFAANRWEWAPLPIGGTLAFADLDAHTSPAPASALYVAVLVTGGSQFATLDRVRVGAQPNTGTPTADLQADQTTGAPPLVVNFDASASTANAPASIVKYEFDLGEGAGFVDNGAVATTSHSYTADGVYTAQVRVTDVFGAQDTAQQTITVATPPPFDEVEPNDFTGEANALPAFRVVDWSGNCGAGGSYDGDMDDWARFNANPGDTISAELISDFGTGNLDLELRDSDGDQLALSSNATNREFFLRDIGPGDTPPFFLHVIGTSGQSDYLLTVQQNPPAPNLAAVPPSGNVPLNTVLDASGSSDLPPGMIDLYEFDPEGDGTFMPGQTGATLNWQYDNAGNYDPVVRMTDNDGNVMTATCTVQANGGGTYDEVEHNDNPGTANQLPPFPFASWLGSNGQSLPDYPGYDGDTADYVRFDADMGETIHLQLVYMVTGASGTMGLQLREYGQNWSLSLFDGDNDGVINMDYTIGTDPGDTGGEYSLSIWSPFGHVGDYTLDGSVS